jgi:phosphohistidine phosphatase
MKSKPDYWYRQSSVIPFRNNNGHLEYLVISTRKKRRWIFPKGIVEIGLSAKRSAEKEALEEAGIKGDLLPKSYGTYKVKKWGGVCKVKVYALNVKFILNEWEESFRDRKWISANEVDKYISNDDLLKIVSFFRSELLKNKNQSRGNSK